MNNVRVGSMLRRSTAWERTTALIDVEPYRWFFSMEKDAIKGHPNAMRIKKVFDEQCAILEMAARLQE